MTVNTMAGSDFIDIFEWHMGPDMGTNHDRYRHWNLGAGSNLDPYTKNST